MKLFPTFPTTQKQRERYRSLLRQINQLQRENEFLKHNIEVQRQAYEKILKVNNDIIFLVDHEGKYLDIISDNEHLLKNSKKDIIGKYVSDLIEPALAFKILDAIQLAIQTGTTQILQYQLPDLKQKYFKASITSLGNDRCAIVITDETEFEQKLSEIKEKETWLRSIFDASRDGFAVELDEKIIFVNDAFVKLYGYESEDELLGQSISIIQSPESDGMMRKYGELRKKGESAPSVYEAKGLCKDGTEIDIEVTASAFEVAGQKYIIDINRNISERKNFEKKLKEQNLQLQKINAELDRFVYSASHDLRAPLRSMLGLIGLFRIDTDTNNYTNYLNRMEKSILSMDNFIQDIINYSRNARQEVCFETFNLHEIVVEMVEAIKHSSPIKIDVQYLYDHRFMLHSDKKRIKIILNNLLSNAFRYYDQDKSHNLIKINAQYVDNKYIISVEDNGIGIDTEHIDKIFNMFYRAHDHKVGSGLGLYIVKETVNVLRGEVTVESKLGEGSIFKIIL